MSSSRSNRASLWFLAITLLSFLAASTAPTPLYRLYQEQLHFSAATLTLIFGVYAFSLLAALLTVGSLSDHLGRKPVIFTAVVLNGLAMLLFIYADSVAWLISARVLQGFATGMATAVLSATLLDTDRQQGPLINSVAPLLGMALGGLGCGLLAEFAPAPLHLTYWLLLILFALQALYIWRLPESVSRQPGHGRRCDRPCMCRFRRAPPYGGYCRSTPRPGRSAVFMRPWRRRWCARPPVPLRT